MRKPTAKMIDALIDLFGHNGGASYLADHGTSTVAGLVERGLITPALSAHEMMHRLTDAGLAWLVDTKRAVVAADGTWVVANAEPMSVDQVTAELIRFESDRALEAETLAKADAVRAAQARRITPGQVVTSGGVGPDFAVLSVFGDTVIGETRQGFAVEADLMKCARVAGAAFYFGGPVVKDCETVGRCLNAYHVGCVSAADESPEWNGIPNRPRPSKAVGVNAAWDQAHADVRSLSYRDQGLVASTAHMLAEGRGSAIVNLSDGSRAWTPVDRVGEFDRASRRAPNAAWAASSIAGGLSATARSRTASQTRAADSIASGTAATQAVARPVTLDDFPQSTRVVRKSDRAPGTVESRYTDGRIAVVMDATDKVHTAPWTDFAPTSMPGRPSVDRLTPVAREITAGHRDATDAQGHHYLTEGGAALVNYRRALAAAAGTETPERVHEHIETTTISDARQRRMQATRELLSADGSARLTVQRLRRGLTLTSGDRTALADLLDTVRRSSAGLLSARPALAAADVANTYRAYFGDDR